MWLARASRQPSSSRRPRKRPGAAWAAGKSTTCPREVRDEGQRGARLRAEFDGIHAAGAPRTEGEVGDGFLADSFGRKLPLYACY
jgi:hypothetical protein